MELVLTTPDKFEEMIESAIARAVYKLSSPPPKQEKSKLGIDEAIEFLTMQGYRVSKSLIYNLTCRKLIPFSKFGNNLLFDKAELLAWAQLRAGNGHGPDAIKQIAKSAQRRLVPKN